MRRSNRFRMDYLRRWGLFLLAGLLTCSITACSFGKKEEENIPFPEAEMSPEDLTESGVIPPENTDAEELTVGAEDCSIIFSDPDPYAEKGYTIHAVMENGSGDKTYLFSIDALYANGLNCNLACREEISPGETVEKDFIIEKNILDQMPYIYRDIRSLEFYIRIAETGDLPVEPLYSDVICIYPYGDTEPVSMEPEVGADDVVWLDRDETLLLLSDSGMEGDDYVCHIYLKNRTGSRVIYSLEDVTMNGVAVDPAWSYIEYPGKSAYTEIRWSADALKENGINEVKEVIFSLVQYAYDEPTAEWRLCDNIIFQP